MMTTSLSGLGARRRRRPSIPLIPVISALMLLAAITWFVVELLSFSQVQAFLPANVSVADVPVGAMVPREAAARWEQVYAQPVVLYYDNNPIVLDPASVGFRVQSEVMLAEASAASDAEGGFWSRFWNHLTGQEEQTEVSIPLFADYQAGLLQQFLLDIAARYDRSPGEAVFDLQTLTLRSGSEGLTLDIEAAIAQIDAALRSPTSRTVVLPLSNAAARQGDIDALRELIIAYLDSEGFIYDAGTTVASVFILDLQTGEEVNLLGDVSFSAASTMKVAILIDYFRHLTFAPTHDEAWLMANSLLCSNNASSNLIMQIIGGDDLFTGISDVVNTSQYLGARNTFLTAPFVLGTEGQEFGSIPAPPITPNPRFNTGADPFNQTTTEDLGTLFAMIYDCAEYGSGLMAAYPNGEFTQTECRQMLELMSANDLLHLLQGGIPAGTRISHKNGWLENVHGDAGVVFSPNGRDYVIAVFLWEDVDFLSYERAWPIIENVSRAAWNYFNPENPMLTPRTDLPPGGAQECVNFLPPYELLDLNDMQSWRVDAGAQITP